MNDNEKNNRIISEYNDLKNKINLWNKAYFDYDEPLVEDSIYDATLLKLIKFENQYKFLDNSDSPTKNIGAKVSKKFSKVQHQFPMLSLNKAYKFDDLKIFERHINKLGFFPNYFLELKIDGLSISLKYDNGNLIQALTRGDGISGEDVTENVFQIQDIPKQIKYSKPIEIRGEIYLSKSTFYEINECQKSQNLTIFANPRNAASGSLRQLDSSIVKERKLNSFFYSVTNPLDHKIKNFNDQELFLKENNFQVPSLNKFVDTIEKAYEFIKDFEKNNYREKLNYEIDGIVVKVDDFSLYDILGQTSKFPRSMIAFKFSDISIETKLIDIFISVGRTGKITYNAILEPVIINGTLVSAATLHNYEYVESLKLNKNDNVKIIKAGEIIPKVVSLSKKNSETIFKRIEYCTSCNEKLVQPEDEVDQYCINKKCLMIRLRKIEHFASKKAMNILGLGFQNIEKFFKLGILTKYSDLFFLEKYKNLIESQPSFGEKSFNNLIESINRSKSNSLEKFIFAIGIKQIGERSAKLIANEVKLLSNLINFDFEKLNNIRDISCKTINSLKCFFSDENEIEEIKIILELGLDFKNLENEFESKKLQGLNFVITGTLSKPRDFFKELIIKNGGNVLNSISNRINYLLTGEKSGSKIEKAQKINTIKILDENEFNKLI